MLWQEGDKNTNFFHKMANMRRISHLGRLRRERRIVTRPKDIKEETSLFFKDRYKSENFVRPKLDGSSIPSISTEARAWLERDFESELVKNALAECGSDKAPGPDGYNFAFIKAGWNFLNKDFMDMFKEFHLGGRLNKAINNFHS